MMCLANAKIFLLLLTGWLVGPWPAASKEIPFAQKGEKCGKGRVLESGLEILCDPRVNLECNGGICDCKSGYTISRNGTKCLEIARNGLESPCDESIQCWKSLLGRLSECNIGTNKCSCYESESLPIVYHQGRCYYGEILGEECQIEGLCSKTTSNAICKMGMCACQDGYVPSWDKSRCLAIATQGLNSSCEENIQCEKSLLGTLSECNQDRMQCECYQIPMVPTVFHQGRCYFGAGLGDVCQVHVQCTSKVRHSMCGKDGKCRCQGGYQSSENQTTCSFIPTTTPLPEASDASEAKPECTWHDQCQTHGHFSRCNTTREKCECYNPDTNATIREHRNHHPDHHGNISSTLKCYSAKYLGQTCKFRRQCSEVTENAVCHRGQCECHHPTHVVSTLVGRKCLEIARKGQESDCDEDIQCTRSILGPLSVCNLDTGKCECTRDFPVIYSLEMGRCFLRRKLGSTCESHHECRADPLAHCLHGRCQCGENTTQSADNNCVPMETSLTVVASNGACCLGDNSFSIYSWMSLSVASWFLIAGSLL